MDYNMLSPEETKSTMNKLLIARRFFKAMKKAERFNSVSGLDFDERDHSDLMYDQYESEMFQLQQQDAFVLITARSMIGTNDFDLLMSVIKEDGGWNFQICSIDEAKGETQPDQEFAYGCLKVDEQIGGGFTGDTFGGDCYIPISPRECFRFSYSM